MHLRFRLANAADADAVVALVNSGYRGEGSKQGWTTEADLLDGTRTDVVEVRRFVEAPNAVILLCERGEELVGSMLLERQQGKAYLGMFVVKPTRQGHGIGKEFIAYAEQFARDEWRVAAIKMSVITVRRELIAYYERRGYRRTGVFEPFPIEGSGSTYRGEPLKLEVLEKTL
jgi:ribosomal protein S18 acetylase RimI-like enzyme